jgi:hypothetical protein
MVEKRKQSRVWDLLTVANCFLLKEKLNIDSQFFCQKYIRAKVFYVFIPLFLLIRIIFKFIVVIILGI